MLLLSVFAIASAPVGFPPGIVLILLLLCIAGVLAVFGQLKLAGLSLALNSIALAISPVTDISRFHNWYWYSSLIYFIRVIVGFTGLIIGINQLQNNQQSQE